MKLPITQTASEQLVKAISTEESILFTKIELVGLTTHTITDVRKPADGTAIGVSVIVDKQDLQGNPRFDALRIYAKVGSGVEFLLATTGITIDFSGDEDRRLILTVYLDITNSEEVTFEYSGGGSAFDVAVAQGFEGTAQEWLDSLRVTVDRYTQDSRGDTVLHFTDGKDVIIETGEADRVSSENARATAESERISAEDVRVSNEEDRQENETTRIANEEARQENYDELVDTGIMEKNINQKLADAEQEYAPRLTDLEQNDADLTAQLAQKANNRAVNYYWNPETQPPARKDLEGWFSDGYGYTAEQYIDNHFEPLRMANQEYITRTLLGKDESGNHDIWRYELTPRNYSKTIILSSVLHGGEVTGMLSMVRFLYYLTEEFEKYPALAYIRENVRIIYIPIVNPWGCSQFPRVRHNSNGVDINRNFSKYWETFDPNGNIPPFSFGHKGAEPFSEVETRYVKETLEAYPSAIAYFDLHNTGSPTNYDFFYVTPSDLHMSEFDRLVDYYSKGMTNPVIFNDTAQLPNACNYTYDTYRIPSAHPEWCDMRRGEKTYDSIEMTGALAWYSNIIIEFCRNYEKEPFIIQGYYAHGTTPIYLNVGASYAEIEEFRIPVKIPSEGLLKVTYNVVFLNTDLTGINYISPVIEQLNTDVHQINDLNNEIYSDNVTARTSLSARASRFVYPTEGIIGDAVIKFKARTTVGQNYIARMRVNVEFTPLSRKSGFTIINANGRAGEGLNAFQTVWKA